METEGDFFREPPREEGKHRFMAGTCVDCGHPLDPVCSANTGLASNSSGTGSWASKTPTDILADINHMFDQVWAEQQKPQTRSFSGPAGQLRQVGFKIPPEIPDERFCTVTVAPEGI